MVITDSREEMEEKSPRNLVYQFALPLSPHANQFRETLQYMLFLDEGQGRAPVLNE